MKETGKPDKTIAIYGGSFDPPQVCHLLSILYVLETHPVDEVWVVPCFSHAFEKESAPFELRKEWCEALIEPFGDKCKVCSIEKEIGGESRTIDTMKQLEKRFPDCSFRLVLGSDIRAERDDWKNFSELEWRFPIIWIGRSGHSESSDDVIILPDISSSAVRKVLTEGQNTYSLIPKRVLKAIEKSGWRWR